MPTEMSGQDESTTKKGVRRDMEEEEVNRKVEGEEKKDVRKTRSHDLVEPSTEPAPRKSS